MSAINGINDRLSLLTVLPNNNRLQQIQNTEKEIARVDREINARSQQVNNIKNLIAAREKYIASNNELIALHKAQKQTLIESRDLDHKRMHLLEQQIEVIEDTNSKLRALLDRGRSKSTEPVKTVKLNEIDHLKDKVDSLAKKDVVLKEQSAKLDDTLAKQSLKLEHVEKQASKLKERVSALETTTPDKAVAKPVNSNKETSDVVNITNVKKKNTSGLASTYSPTASQIREQELLNIKRNAEDLQGLNKVLQERVYHSQRNIYESIVSNKIMKLL